MEEDQKNTEHGTWNEHDRIANSDFIYAAKEVCGPIAYNGKGVTAAWPRMYRQAHKDEEVIQPHDDGRASG